MVVEITPGTAVCCRCSSCTERPNGPTDQRTDEKKNASKQTSSFESGEREYTVYSEAFKNSSDAPRLHSCPSKKHLPPRATRCSQKGLGGGSNPPPPPNRRRACRDGAGRREVPGSSVYKTPDAWQGSRRAVARTESPCSRQRWACELLLKPSSRFAAAARRRKRVRSRPASSWALGRAPRRPSVPHQSAPRRAQGEGAQRQPYWRPS